MLQPLDYNIEAPQPESLSGFQFRRCQSGVIFPSPLGLGLVWKYPQVLANPRLYILKGTKPTPLAPATGQFPGNCAVGIDDSRQSVRAK
ncbi:hypothetical protein [Laspinema olomoucense]|uniref:hypothetical protein n=1 Tax=Laspinema olomoucense TaxID=3231600 RepID=UPI0021BA6C66|nr:hypothetical protein [Laspinema sp. D3d]MCT7972629.1 hypothetical protein [Laspinema sp. D3d]